MKKKGIIFHGGSKMFCQQNPSVSGRGPGGYWVNQLPFYQKSGSRAPNVNYAATGFSVNGGHRTNKYIGKSSSFSKVSTPYRGTAARGFGGTGGQYPIAYPIPATLPEVAATQQLYIKPSVLTTKCMLRKKLTFILSSTYPNAWVQPTYPTGTQDANASQGSYIEKVKSANCTNPGNFVAICNGNSCKKKSLGSFTKVLKSPQPQNSYSDYLDRKCLNPKGDQKPFPFNVRNNRIFPSDCQNCGSEATEIYYKPPKWYTDKC